MQSGESPMQSVDITDMLLGITDAVWRYHRRGLRWSSTVLGESSGLKDGARCGCAGGWCAWGARS